MWRAAAGCHDSVGFTMVELLLALALFTLIAVAAYGVLRAQLRFYVRHALVSDIRTAARVASRVLTVELRGASPAVGDLYGIGSDSVALRSTTGVGFVCDLMGATLGLWSSHGVFGTLPTDSLMIFIEGDPAVRADDSWIATRILSVSSASDGACGGRADLAVTVEADLGAVRTGVPVRAFRPYVYRLYRASDGLWWLGQRLRYGTLQPVAGPLAPMVEGGLSLEWLDGTGQPASGPWTTLSARVSVVGVSPVRYPTDPGLERVELSSRVFLRNAGR